MNYKKTYNNIIENAKIQNRCKLDKINPSYVYYEKHHIIPRCIGGTNDESNLVILTPKEHYMTHKLLTKIWPNNKKIGYAFFYMSINKKGKYNVSLRDYAYAREQFMTTPFSKEMLENLSKSLTGKKFTPEHCNNLSKSIIEKELHKGEKNGMYGKTHSEKSKEKNRLAHIGKSVNGAKSAATRLGKKRGKYKTKKMYHNEL